MLIGLKSCWRLTQINSLSDPSVPPFVKDSGHGPTPRKKNILLRGIFPSAPRKQSRKLISSEIRGMLRFVLVDIQRALELTYSLECIVHQFMPSRNPDL